MPSNSGSPEPPDDPFHVPLSPEMRQALMKKYAPEGGSPETSAERIIISRKADPGLADLLKEGIDRELKKMQAEDEAQKLGPMPQGLTTEEQQAIADGEPYCFRCGKPASSFEIYEQLYDAGSGATAAEWVREQEGTYNPETNRFACDACYIAIGMPTAPLVGWIAP